MFKSDENRSCLQNSKRTYKSYIKRRECAFYKLWKYFSEWKHKTGDDIERAWVKVFRIGKTCHY